MADQPKFSKEPILRKGQFYAKIEKDDLDYKLINDYATLLLSPPWRQKRKEILQRDHYKCTQCTAHSTLNNKGVYYTALEQFGFNEKRKPIYRLVVTKTPVSLHVHHKLYVLARLPWNYTLEELITLCHNCHTKEHENTIIPVYKTEAEKKSMLSTDLVSCWKCGGEGYLPEYHYHDNGVCYTCNSIGFLRKI